MGFSELMGYLRVFGQPQGKTLVAIPCFSEHALLCEHLLRLGRQDCREFDALAILGPNFDERKIEEFVQEGKFGFPIILCRRKEDTGSAGGFFAGQLFALENGYENVIHADVDCMPEDPALVSALIAAAKSGHELVSPSVVFTDATGQKKKMDSARRGELASVSHYTLVSCAALKKHGLYFAPLYTGYEDAEFLHRLGGQRFFIDNVCTHPDKGSGLFANPERSAGYAANQALFMPPASLPKFALINSAVLPMFWLFCGRRGKGAYSGFIRALAKFRFGKGAIAKPAPAGADADAPEPQGEDFAKLTGGKRGLALAAKIFRKKVIIGNGSAGADLRSMAILVPLAASVAAENGQGKLALVSQNTSPILHAAKLLAYPFAVAFTLAFICLSSPINMLRRPKTAGFGLNGNR